MANSLIEDALKSLNNFNEKADPLRWMARYIITRQF